MKPAPATILLAAVAGLAACADRQPPRMASAPAYARDSAVAATGAPQCFASRDVHNHTVGDPRTLYLQVGVSRVYRVEMSTPCLAGATPSDPLIIRNDTGALSICQPIELDVGVMHGGFENRCIVSAITPLSPDEAAALPRRLRP